MDENGDETTQEIHFFYDAQSKPAFVEFEGEKYRYIHNLQGDVIAIVDGAGNVVVEYVYNAWGNLIYNTVNELASINPFCYRGYVRDAETNDAYLVARFVKSVFQILTFFCKLFFLPNHTHAQKYCCTDAIISVCINTAVNSLVNCKDENSN